MAHQHAILLAKAVFITASVIGSASAFGIATRLFPLHIHTGLCSQNPDCGVDAGTATAEHFFAGNHETAHGMPWSTSISENSSDRVEFMPFWNWQMAHMQDHLTDLEMIRVPANLTYAENNSRNNNKARVINLTFRSAECRKIRVLYYDAGSTQVYNTMWYSDESIDAPVLGISIMGFGGKRYLAMADFQPLHGDGNAELPRAFRDALIDIRGRSPTLHGKLSGRYYEGTRYFSEHILHGRFSDASAVEDSILPAFQTCVSEYAALLRRTTPDDSQEGRCHVGNLQAAYDTYCGGRDPATQMFGAAFGKEWAMRFVYDSLFNLGEKPPEYAELLEKRNGEI